MQDKLTELEKKYSVDWREFKIGELFEIRNTLSFNKDKLVLGNEYDYVTRTSQNQGILQETGFVNQEHLNPPGIWSLGLLQMDFFYRKKPWYAGQFVRKIIPKRDLSKNAVLYFTVLLNKQKKTLLSGLVRDVDKNFLTSTIKLPTLNNEIAFDYIEEFISTLEGERLATLEAYLVATGLKDIELSNEERQALDKLYEGSVSWREFEIEEMFEVRKGKRLPERVLNDTKGNIALVSQSTQNNMIARYSGIQGNNEIYRGNAITFGVNTKGLGFQQSQFYTIADVLFLKADFLNIRNSNFIKSVIEKSIPHSGWDEIFGLEKMKKLMISLPVKEDWAIDYDFMENLIKAMQKLVIKDVVKYLDERIDTTSQIIKDL